MGRNSITNLAGEPCIGIDCDSSERDALSEMALLSLTVSWKLQRDHNNTLANSMAKQRSRWRIYVAIGLVAAIASCAVRLLPPSHAQARADKAITAPGRPADALPVARRPARQLAEGQIKECDQFHNALDTKLEELGASFSGTVGIAVKPIGCSRTAGFQETRYFPQQSVSKLWVTLAVLDAADRKVLRLEHELRITKADLTVFNQPLRHEIITKGAVTRSLSSLMRYALSLSDNTANNALLQKVGGPRFVRQVLQHKQLTGIRFGPGEKALQSAIAGLPWKAEYSFGGAFYAARAKLAPAQRKVALDAYLADPIDGAKPAAIVDALEALATGQLLSEASTRHFLDELSKTRSGPLRLKGGAPAGWTVYHKTGTGQQLGARATGYNDVGLLRSPNGAYYAVAVMIGETRLAIPARMQLMQAVTRAIVQFEQKQRRTSSAPRQPQSEARSVRILALRPT